MYFCFLPTQYENQALLFGKWGTSGLVGRHKFSDVTGKIKLKREYFLPPKGWDWEGEWMVDPERRSDFLNFIQVGIKAFVVLSKSSSLFSWMRKRF